MLRELNIWAFSYVLAILLSTFQTQAQDLRLGFPLNQRNPLLNLAVVQLIINQRQRVRRAVRRVGPRIGGGWGPLLGPNGERLNVYPYNTQGRITAMPDNVQDPDHTGIVQQVYGPRAVLYDASFHIVQAADYIRWAALKAGQNVLDLACGTGLVTLLAKEAVGPLGRVVGIDITAPMLAQAKKKAQQKKLDILFINHDVTNLSGIGLPDDFDVITCSSAFVLLQNPRETVKRWTGFLKPGGRIILDVPAESSQLGGQMLAQAARKLGINLAFDSSWVTGPDTVKELLESAGLSAQVFESPVYGSSSYDEAGGLRMLDAFLTGPFAPMFRDERIRPTARELFSAEFKNRQNSKGIVQEDTWFYMGIGTKQE
jgi:ubiquinone/menaquinone biosynthesis C-methylase UbiE